mgnify:CR=1
MRYEDEQYIINYNECDKRIYSNIKNLFNLLRKVN